jgi:hypothetical protein
MLKQAMGKGLPACRQGWAASLDNSQWSKGILHFTFNLYLDQLLNLSTYDLFI